MAEEIGNNIIIKPKYKQKLEPGVYTYKFNYLVNRALYQKGDSVIMDWNTVGKPMNTFITSANAIITLPSGNHFQSTQTYIGKKNYSNRRSNFYPLAKNVIAFSGTTPVMNGENIHIVTMVDKKAFLKNFDKGYNNFVSDWGNILYASMGLITILLSYLLSWREMKKNKKSVKYNPIYNGSLLRQLLISKYDRIALITQLLDLYRKKAIDITTEDNRIFLHRKASVYAKLNKIDKKALKLLFGKKTNKFEINNTQGESLKKVRLLFESFNNKLINKHRLTRNLSFFIFSCAILFLTEVFIATNNINFTQNFLILFTATCLYLFYIWITYHRFKKWYIALPIKLLSLLAVLSIWFFSSIYIGFITGFLIIMMVCITFLFTRLFNEKNNYINESKTAITSYREYLISNAETVNLGREFLNQQANIFALDISEYFPKNKTNQNFYKLDIAEMLKKSLIGIL